MTYAIEYFAGEIPEPLTPADVVWQRLADVVGVDYEDLADVMSLIADLELCEESRGKYRLVEFFKNGRPVNCCSCGDEACQVPEGMPSSRVEMLPRRPCRSCGLPGKIEVTGDDEGYDYEFRTDEAEAETFKLVDALLVDMADEIRQQRRAEGERQRGWTYSKLESGVRVWGPTQ